MTTKAQKEAEERYAKMLLDGHTEYSSIEPDEGPDFWVRRSTAPDIALEVTEYHPEAEGVPGELRSAVESRWWKDLEPVLDRERKARPSLQDVQVHLGFNDRRLPKKRSHTALATELVRLVEEMAKRPTAPGQEVEVIFLPRNIIAATGVHAEGSEFLAAEEEWPQAAEHLAFLHASHWPGVNWPPWLCQNVTTAWLGVAAEELRRAFDKKARLARRYNLGGAPLWLLLVCEVRGDLQSHIFPQNNDDVVQFLAKVQETGFDFEGGPFSEVWLLSAFSAGRLRLHPLQA